MNDNKGDRSLPTRSSAGDIDQFLTKVAAMPVTSGGAGRLIFAMDATASREATWDHACHIQAQMFQDTRSLGGLQIQLCYYRGFANFDSSRWFSESAPLLEAMTSVHCLAGHTQIGRVLQHCLDEARIKPLHALVFVGDSMEEDPDQLGHLAGQLGLLNIPLFLFQEGHDPIAERTFRHLAKLSKGAYCRFDANSPDQLRALLGAVAVYAAGGRKALENLSRSASREVRLISQQITGKG